MKYSGIHLAFGSMRFLRSGHADVDDPHYKGAPVIRSL